MTNKEKFLQLVSDRDSETLKRNRWRINNREMLRKNEVVALEIFKRLDENNMTLDELREKLGDDTYFLNKLITGKLKTEIWEDFLLRLQKVLP